VRSRLHAELVMGDTAEAALERLGDRVPDLILTTPLLSPKDEQALGDRLRKLNGVAAHVQTLTLPLFAPPIAISTPPPRGSMFSALLGESKPESTPDGCDPAVFAEQCREYLERSALEREATVEAHEHHEDHEVHDVDDVDEDHEDVEQPEQELEEEAFVDVDLSELLEVEAEAVSAADVEEEPPVYELSANPLADDFDDWQQVVDALKREGARTQLPRRKEREEVPAAPPPAPTRAPAAIAAAKRPQDEWGIYDPDQAGMAALFAKLEELTSDDDAPARPA